MTTQTRVYSLTDLYEQRFAPISTLDLGRVSATIQAYAADLTMRVDEMLNDFTEEVTQSRAVWGGAPQMAFDEVNEYGRGKPRADVAGQELHFPLYKLSATQEASEEFWRIAKGKNVLDLLTSMDIGYAGRIVNEVKASIFNNTIFTPVKDWLVDNSTLNKVQPFLNKDSATIPPAPNGATFTSASHGHYLGVTGSVVATSDMNYLTNHVAEHGAGNIVIFVDPGMPATLSGLASTKFVAKTPVTIVNNSAAQVAREGFDPNADRSNMSVGYWDGYEVVTRSWIPTNYILAMNVSGNLGKPLYRRVDQTARGLITAPEVTNGILRVKEQHFYIGFGAFNRAAGAVLDCATGSNGYTVPTGLVRK
jgi:hypothetical protein